MRKKLRDNFNLHKEKPEVYVLEIGQKRHRTYTHKGKLIMTINKDS